MDVIESLKHKTEENEDPPEELSDEEINGMENPDPASGITGTSATENSENADVKEDLQNSPAKPKPKRASKRLKLDSGGSSSFDGSNEEENRISVEKPGCSNGDSKVKKVESGVPKGLTNDGDGSVKQNVGLQSRSRKIPAATADEGDSPASTLQLQSSDEDFE